MYNNNEKRNEQELPIVPAARIYHGSPDNSGSALSVRVYPATIQKNGFVQMEFAAQSEAGDGSQSSMDRFDWKHRAVIRLNFAETAELVRVFSSGSPSPVFLSRDSSPKWQASFDCTPLGGGDSRVELSLRYKAGENPCKTISITLSGEEALGLGLALQSVMGRLCFG